MRYLGTDVPEWLYLQPSVYLQQIVVRGIVDPWEPTELHPPMVRSFGILRPHRILFPILQAIKGPLSRAFTVQKRLREFVTESNKRLENQCYHVHSIPVMPMLPSHGCLVLTPALFWTNDEERFFQVRPIYIMIILRARSWGVRGPKHGGPNGGPYIRVPPFGGPLNVGLGTPLGTCGAPIT